MLLGYVRLHVQGGAYKSGAYMLYVNQAVRQFWKRLASIVAGKDGYSEQLNTVFNMSALYCNGRG